MTTVFTTNILTLLLTAAAFGQQNTITLVAGDVTLRLDRTRRWTMTYLEKNGLTLCENENSAQGTVGFRYDLDHAIWDRASDNKLYARFRAVEGPVDPGRLLSFQQVVSFFSAPPDQWIDTAAQLVPKTIPGDLDADEDLDRHDFLTFLSCNNGASNPPPPARI